MASDTTNGSKTVMITGQEVMLKDQSTFKTSTGDEAGNAPKKGVVTSQIKGEANFCAWSMDVKFDGANIPRHLDMMMHNEACSPANTPPWMYLDKMSMEVAPVGHPCKKQIDKAQKNCKSSKPPEGGRTYRICDDEGDCEKAMGCILVPKGKDEKLCCSPNNTGHHLIEDHWVKGNSEFPMAQGSGYMKAPTVCANQFRTPGTLHRKMHDIQGTFEESFKEGGARYNSQLPNGGWTYGQGKAAAMTAHARVYKSSECTAECLESQLDDFYKPDSTRALNEPSTQGLGESRESMARQFNPPMRATPQGL